MVADSHATFRIPEDTTFEEVELMVVDLEDEPSHIPETEADEVHQVLM